ncbi:MAG: hypothetical protein IJW92_01305 [Clostridia bacterium]|nr:hypothetical protein [Clostridia bacterium]
MIDNWNEWDESHFVAPSHKFGYQYLQAIRDTALRRIRALRITTPHGIHRILRISVRIIVNKSRGRLFPLIRRRQPAFL